MNLEAAWLPLAKAFELPRSSVEMLKVKEFDFDFVVLLWPSRDAHYTCGRQRIAQEAFC